jgi:hypothetical protein
MSRDSLRRDGQSTLSLSALLLISGAMITM